MNDLFGLNPTPEPPPPPPPAPEPAPRKRRSPAAEVQPDPAAAASAAHDQQRRLEALADAAAALQQRAAAAALPTPPVTTTVSPPTSAEIVIERWRAALADPATLGLPAGTRTRVVPVGAGVAVQFRVPVGTNLAALAGRLISAADARGWGTWRGEILDSTRMQLVRDVVGEEPAAPWKAAGPVAHRVYAGHQAQPGEIGTRRAVFEAAGLVVKTAAGAIRLPRVHACRVGPRGPEILVDLPPGMAVDAAVKAAPALANIFKCPDLVVVPAGVRARIELRTRPELTFPAAVPLDPATLWRPTTPEQRLLTAPHLVLPVGVTADGSPIMVPLASRPHTVIAGTSGSGKSRTLQTMVVGLCLQGAQVAVGDFKGDPDLAALAAAKPPGLVHHSTTLAGISRLVLWMRDELALRSALLPLLARRGIARPMWDPVVVVIDEWGQGCDELLNSPDPAEREAAAAMVNTVSKLFAQGRSFGLHLILSTQHTYASALPGRIAQNAGTRIVMGRPKPGQRGPLAVLFADAGDEAAAAADGIIDGMRGRGIVADQAGRVQQFQSYFGYSPVDAGTVTDPALSAAWKATAAALARTPRQPRWGWKFPISGPGGDGSWQEWSLYPGTEKAPRPTVEQLDVIELDDETGQPDPAHAAWDPLSSLYAPGAAPLADRHRPTTTTKVVGDIT